MNSYQVLARKWRPQRFNQVVGQQHVLSALENSLRENRLHHAYLFSGTRGVGKTSIARLFAKGLNCEQGISADPCGECAHCKAIERGQFIDLIEIDAASRTKVEDTRELLDNVQYKPTVGRFKVYLIDEVHMLSRSSFNALLKTLEEPPEYVKFLLATTDPQKLPITILSRCMQFHLRALEQAQIQHHLEFVLSQEAIPFESLAVAKLAKAAQGSIRDSLSLTDQAIVMSNGHITVPVVSQMLGLLDDNQPIELIQALTLAEGEGVMRVIEAAAAKGIDWQQLLSNVAETLHQIAMLQLLPQKLDEETQLHFLARQMPPEDVQFFYQVMLAGKKELPYASDPRQGVEMTMLRALAFHPKHIEPMSLVPHSKVESDVVLSSQVSRLAHLREQVAQQVNQSVAQVSGLQKKPQPVEQPTDNSNASSGAAQSAEETSHKGGMSPAMQALQASRQLREQQSESEKKKSELTSVKNSPSVANATPKSKNVVHRLGQFLASQEHKQDLKPAESQVIQRDEEYRWTWLNPELEIQNESAKPSEIKQAILQERTPELIRKTIELACTQDEWSQWINELNLSGFSKQLALNSYIESRDKQSIKLVLKPSMAQFNNEESRRNLSNALAQKGLSMEMRLGESTTCKTPLEIRRMIFENLTLAAKEALLADQKLRLLREAFDADIDESTIRAVAE